MAAKWPLSAATRSAPLRWSLKRSRNCTAKLKRIAIIRLSSLGDIVHTLPAFQALRRHDPDAEISWIAEPAGAALLENFPGIDRILVFELKARKGWIARMKIPVRLRAPLAPAIRPDS